VKIRFVTLGCKLNFAESSALGKELLLRGHQRALGSEVPDICVVNTCSVTDAADHKDRQAINQLHRKYPQAVIVVTGCYAQLQPEQISKIEGVDYVLGQHEKYDITQLVDEIEQSRSGSGDSVLPAGCSQSEWKVNGEKVRVGAIREVDDFHGVRSGDDRTRCFIKVQDGCNYFCSYCTIPYARGKSRNPKIEEVVKNVQAAIEQGAKELIITGVNIGDFGRSTGESFIDLLRAIEALDGDFRVRISSCEPNLLTDEIIDLVAMSRHFAPHFHIPLQSGSNEVLKIMGRRYTRELFAERVQHIKAVMPHAFIGVDCMVGVRGETQDCWEDYLEFVKSLDVSQLHVFTYSERANTRMLDMDLYVVPKVERQRRSKILHEVSEAKTRAFYQQHAGRKSVVLWESKREGDQMAGFTDNYIKVYTTYQKEKVNTFEELVI
jgi:threonylcarbamoyladenosine tRNA methylthiotransferase MtaB